MYEVDKYTVSLLHFDDGFKDETGKVWTAKNSAAVSTDQSKFGESSLFLNGSQYLNAEIQSDFKFGTGDFTAECWIYPVSFSSSWNVIFDTRKIVSSGTGFCLCLYKGALSVVIDNNTRISTGNASLNSWQHVAITRANGFLYQFLNGKLVYSEELTNDISDGYAYIGENINVAFPFDGYIDEFRISKGIARWTEDFDPTATVTAPTNLTATAGDSQVILSWTAVDGATSYTVKRSTTSGGTYETIASGVTDTNYVDTSVTNGTTYYYVVVAVNDKGESNNSNEASATPVDNSKFLLRVTMLDSSERDYQLSATEIDGFINWYMKHTSTDTTGYILTKKVGTEVSKEYLTLDKIISFEVIER
ncbi:MAG: hypothetical protein H6Q70_1888 [Firmicutes bacterium]|nr:hypothetical protein [Bacillota bacterium]